LSIVQIKWKKLSNGITGRFGSMKVFNPWSIMNYISKGKLGEYWTKTAVVGSLSVILTPHLRTILPPILDLLCNPVNKQKVSKISTQVNYISGSPWGLNSILHFLVLSGYLTYTESGHDYYVSVPNKEVEANLISEVKDQIQLKIDPKFLTPLQNALHDLNLPALEVIMKQMLLSSSFFDVVKTYENCYNMFFLGIFLTAFHSEDIRLIKQRIRL